MSSRWCSAGNASAVVAAAAAGKPVVTTEIGDGGFTDWTAKLMANRKERLLISGYGLDRIAAWLSAAPGN